MYDRNSFTVCMCTGCPMSGYGGVLLNTEKLDQTCISRLQKTGPLLVWWFLTYILCKTRCKSHVTTFFVLHCYSVSTMQHGVHFDHMPNEFSFFAFDWENICMYQSRNNLCLVLFSVSKALLCTRYIPICQAFTGPLLGELQLDPYVRKLYIGSYFININFMNVNESPISGDCSNTIVGKLNILWNCPFVLQVSYWSHYICTHIERINI